MVTLRAANDELWELHQTLLHCFGCRFIQVKTQMCVDRPVTVNIAKNWKYIIIKGVFRIFPSKNSRVGGDPLSHRDSQAEILSCRGKRRACKLGRREFQQGVTPMSRGPLRDLCRLPQRHFLLRQERRDALGSAHSGVTRVACDWAESNATSASSNTLHHAKAKKIVAPTFATKMRAARCPKVAIIMHSRPPDAQGFL